MQIVTRGYGPEASLRAVVLRGYLTGYPEITAISTLTPSAAFTVDGYYFGASPGTLSVGGQSQSVTWGNSQLTGSSFTQGNLQYFAYHDVIVTSSSAHASQAFQAPIALPSGHTAVDLTSIESNSAYRITAVADIEAGDQLEARNVQGGDISDLTLFSDGTFQVNEGVTGFEVRAWDADDQSWGAYAVQTIPGNGGSQASICSPIFLFGEFYR